MPDSRQVAYVDDVSGQFNRRSSRPGGRSLLFLADAKGDENTQMYLLDLARIGSNR